MKKILVLAIMGFSIIFLTGNAEALLLGDTITLSHNSPTLGSVAPSDTADRLVVADDSDRWDLASLYSVFPEDCGVEVDFNWNATWVTYDFNGLSVSNIDAVIQSVAVDTNMVGWDSSRLSFSDHQMNFNWASLPFTTSTYFDATINNCTGGGVVPEPATIALFVTGLLGTGLFRRKRG